MQNKTKKEVSCKILTPYFYLVNEKGVDISQILHDIPYDKSYLMKRTERIEWSTYCKLIHNMRCFFTPDDFEEVGRLHVKRGFYPEGVLAGFIFFSSNKFSKMLSKQIFRIGDQMFSCIKYKIEYAGKTHIKVTAYLDESYENLPEFFYLTKGAWLQLGRMIGHKEFNININWIHQGGIFNISWEREKLFFKVKRGFRWLFSIRKAFFDLTNSHQQLLDQYQQLEESKKLLQKQTTQLKTAHNISSTLRRSLDIEPTLRAVTSALVNDAEFSAAGIVLTRDIEGNQLNISVSEGTWNNLINSIKHPLIINDEKIGEITIYPKIGTDPYETDELLDHLLPVITISIHDSLVLRAVTDYKNNLELKVEERTAELSEMQHKLSQTIDLLKDAQLAQNRFFTNISHEFRTPLTLIMGPSRQIMEMTDNDGIIENAKLINRNAKKLNRLASQLLDISRIEAGHMKLKVSPHNIVSMICDIISSFQSFAESKKIVLTFQSESNEIMLFIDKDKFEKIMSNLLSNALKFTPEGGSVYINVKRLLTENGFTQISVSDTGIGIPNEQLEKIFDRFYQVDNRISKQFEGTGVGLSLTRELVELHKGKIIVESKEGKGSTFTVLLPADKEHFNPDELSFDMAGETENIKVESHLSPVLLQSITNNKNNGDETLMKDNKPSLLVIEDNSELRYYIKGILSDEYNIIEAENGEDGLIKATERVPDLIISDIMMPGLDGIQLCRQLKSEPETSHIPLIYLTAKATLNDKIEGLETGADDYIMKPFEAEELKARTKNILNQKKRLHDYFRKHGLFEINEEQVMPIDKQFLQNAMKVINEHISDSSFSTEVFADSLAISRSLLNKKLTSLIGESPGELIKRIRLHKASEMIKNNMGNFTEIAYDVGFKDPSYFSVCFKKQFGMSPSEYLHSTVKG